MRKKRRNRAAYLINLAESLIFPKDAFVIGDGCKPRHIARARLAVEFYRRPSVFKLRAIVEDWGFRRIVREMY